MAVASSTASLSPGERQAATRELMAAADACCDPAQRRAMLLQAAALNADVALAITSSLCLRYRHVAADDPVLRAQVEEAYLRAVVALPRGADLLSGVLPALREAVVSYGRGLEPSS